MCIVFGFIEQTREGSVKQELCVGTNPLSYGAVMSLEILGF